MKIALTGPDTFTVWRFRRGLITALAARGIAVHVISPEDDYVERIQTLPVVYHPVPFSRFTNPAHDLKYLLALWRIFRQERFDIVHNNTIKANVYGAIAAKLAGCPKIIAMLEGLGFTFSPAQSVKHRVVQALGKMLYRLGLGLSDAIWFVNQDDCDAMTRAGFADPRKSVVIRSGGGLNLAEFSAEAVDAQQTARLRQELEIADESLVVTLVVARLLWSKGVGEFIQAAERLRAAHPQARFLLVGPLEEDSPDAVPERFMREKLPENVAWLGFRDDVREILSLTDLVVLPSYYGEGLPYVLLEGMAMSKPIVTTDNVGCREVIEEGRNGYLVPPKDAGAFAGAIERLLSDDAKRRAFGAYSRQKMEEEFDEQVIIQHVLTTLYGIE